jgi:Fuc2NAc and GlcNAc transferase
VAPFGVSLLVACAATALLVRLAGRLELLDHPNLRSSHVRVTPRGGGIAIVIGAACGLIAGVGRLERFPAEAAALLAGAAALALVGLADDRYRLSRGLRLVLEAAAATPVAVLAGGIPRLPLPAPLDVSLGPAAIPLAILWIVALVNFFNFMDGIDGLAAAQAVITGIGVSLLGFDPVAAVIGAAVAGAAAGFLPFNWAPARIFMGDTGSLALGYTFASLPLLAPFHSRPQAVFWMVMSLWLFLADATWTLVARIARGDAWLAPHRQHAYQRLVRPGSSHGPVAAAIALGSAALTVGALLSGPRLGGPAGWTILAAAIGLFLAESALASRRERAAAHAR